MVDRRDERRQVDTFLGEVRAGNGQSVVLRGDPGIGKSALLDYLVGRASGFRLMRAVGVESEMELAYAGLHQLLTPMVHRAEELPAPQREALRTAFGLSDGPAPDRFLVGLATLGLLAEVAEEYPLVCVIDDLQWLDRASAQVLGFVGRRLDAEPVGMVFATRAETDELAGLQEIRMAGLEDVDARALLAASLAAPLDAQVADRLVADSGGNPLALLELPRGLGPAELAGGFALPSAIPVSGRIEASFRRRLEGLPVDTRRFLAVAAAEPVGDPVLVWQAAERIGVGADAAAPAAEAGLLEVGARVWFRHPLMRSVAYRSTSAQVLQEVHQALAEVTNAGADPDRRAWHLAHAASGPDDQVADELERSAERAQARGGMAAAAAFLRRAVELTKDPVRRGDRALAAAQASFQAGAFDAALGLLGVAETGTLERFQQARVDLLRGHVAFASGNFADAPRLLLKAAAEVKDVDLDLARETYLNAWAAAVGAGHLAEDGLLLEVCEAVQALPVSDDPQPLEVLLEGLASLLLDGRAVAVPKLLSAAQAFASGNLPVEDMLRWGWLAAAVSIAAWDDDDRLPIAERTVDLVRDTGAIAQLPVILTVLGTAALLSGDFARAGAAVAEADTIAAATGSVVAPHIAVRLLSLQGKDAEASAMIEATIAQAGEQSITATNAYWAAAMLHNGRGRYGEAAAAATLATSNAFEPWVSIWALPELIEAAARSGDTKRARDALERLIETTRPSGTEWALGIEARSRALLHNYPFHREAGYLAQVFENVYFDVGLGVNYTGAQSRQLIAESLELAPFHKHLFSSDAWGPSELHVLGALQWRRGMATVVGQWVQDGDWSQPDAERVIHLIAHENASRVYRL